MTKRKVWLYTCEHCGKSNRSGGSMVKHENHCTANPHRICRMHAHCEKPQVAIQDLVAALKSYLNPQLWDEDKATEALYELADGCPACMLAAMRQSGLIRNPEFGPEGVEDEGFFFKWKFKEALAEFWAVKNAADFEAGLRRELRCG